jgi:hypothetical protein
MLRCRRCSPWTRSERLPASSSRSLGQGAGVVLHAIGYLLGHAIVPEVVRDEADHRAMNGASNSRGDADRRLCPTACPTGPKFPMAKPKPRGIIIRV